jgi:hypothetical protein
MLGSFLRFFVWRGWFGVCIAALPLCRSSLLELADEGEADCAGSLGFADNKGLKSRTMILPTGRTQPRQARPTAANLLLRYAPRRAVCPKSRPVRRWKMIFRIELSPPFGSDFNLVSTPWCREWEVVILFDADH